MCGFSDIKIKNKKIEMGFGYFGGSLSIDNIYLVESGKIENIREFIKENFKDFTREDLLEMIAQLVQNGDEG